MIISMPRGRTQHFDASILEAALLGLRHQFEQIVAKMDEIKNRLGKGVRRLPISGAGSAPKKRTISPEGRRRIAAAQRRRWAEQKKSQAAPEKQKRTLSAAGRRRISAAAKKRWAKFRANKAAA